MSAGEGAIEEGADGVNLEHEVVEVGGGKVSVQAVDAAEGLDGGGRGQQAVAAHVVGLSELDEGVENVLEGVGDGVGALDLEASHGVKSSVIIVNEVEVAAEEDDGIGDGGDIVGDSFEDVFVLHKSPLWVDVDVDEE